MGTRSLTHIKEDGFDSPTICTIYRQYDGYPEGMGADIKKALGDREMVNGYSNPKKQTNGMGDAAALLIAAIKDPGMAGNVYLRAPDSSDCGEEYVYTLAMHENKLWLACEGGDKPYRGPLDEFDPSAA